MLPEEAVRHALFAASPAKNRAILVPGRDLPMVLEGGAPRHLGKRKAAIRAWFGDDMRTLTTFDLAGGAATGPDEAGTC
jgi:hypothetical protein